MPTCTIIKETYGSFTTGRTCEPGKIHRGISIRTVLWYLIFVGFAVNYSFRININIAIVSMVESHHYEHNNNSHSSECFESTTLEMQPSDGVNFTRMYTSTEEKFDWNEKQQGLILGAFFWIHWLFQVPGGMLAQKYGTKLVFGLSNFVSCCFSFLIPICARADYRLLIFLRAVQGLISGLAWPSMHLLVANWIPPTERSKFVSAYMGSSIGAAMTYPLCGLLINWFGWASVFYFTGAVGVVWFIAWWILVYDSPLDHPYISRTEQGYILSSLGESVVKIKPSTPWKKILLCRSVWMNILAQWGNIWGLFTLMTQAPTYFRFIHGWDIRTTGLLSGVPHLCRTTLAIGVSALGDLLLKKGALTQTGLRKIATGICCIGQGLCVFALALSGCNAWAAIVFLTMATATSGAVSTGPLASYIDISPNFSSIMLGISNMLTVVPGFISPVIVGMLTYQNQTVSQWTIVFIISTIMLIIPGILYAIFASSELEEWNTPSEGVQKHELEKLRNADENKDLPDKQP